MADNPQAQLLYFFDEYYRTHTQDGSEDGSD
jgi:hypothetical protein